MANRAKRHVHKYHQINLTYAKVWACALPDCTHHMPAHMSGMIVGKWSLCWGCDNPLILDSDNMEMDRPICDACIHVQKERINHIQNQQVIDKSKLSNALSEMGLFNEPTDDLDDMIQKTFIDGHKK